MEQSFNVSVVENGYTVSTEAKVGGDYEYKTSVFVKTAPMVKMFKTWVKNINGGEVKKEAPVELKVGG